MKKITLILSMALLACLSSCNKEKVCRCAVTNFEAQGVNGNTIRLITINKGSCEQLRWVYYDRNAGLIDKDQNITDSVLCTDYHFDGDPEDPRTQR